MCIRDSSHTRNTENVVLVWIGKVLNKMYIKPGFDIISINEFLLKLVLTN